jgi:putative membrane protein
MLNKSKLNNNEAERFSLPLFLKGMSMGIADIIPGVSGGTIAFIFGIYPRLLSAISSVDRTAVHLLRTFEFKKLFKHIDGLFLVNLISGILFSIILLARLMHYLMEYYAAPTWGFFLGLIFASAYALAHQIDWAKNYIRYKLALLTGAAIGFGLVSIIPVQTPDNYGMYFLSGMIAITAMILPGISGSFMLLIMGKYHGVMAALKQPFITENFLILVVFSLGCITGLLFFARFLKWLLNKFPMSSLALLIGFIIVSLKKVWPWRQVLESTEIKGKTVVLKELLALPDQWMAQDYMTIVLFFMGILAIYFIHKKSHK